MSLTFSFFFALQFLLSLINNRNKDVRSWSLIFSRNKWTMLNRHQSYCNAVFCMKLVFRIVFEQMCLLYTETYWIENFKKQSTVFVVVAWVCFIRKLVLHSNLSFILCSIYRLSLSAFGLRLIKRATHFVLCVCV